MSHTSQPAGQHSLPVATPHPEPKGPPPGPSKYADGHPLAPGELPNITDTDPPALHPATVIRDGFVGIDEKKLKASHEQHDNRSKPAHA